MPDSKNIEAATVAAAEHAPPTKVAVRRGFKERGWEESFEMFWESYELALDRRELARP